MAGQYLGFMVIKPLPGSPIGRTVLRTFERDAPRGGRREFTAIRRYTVSLAGLSLSVRGLAFQQQDQGVSACATTALWSALQRNGTPGALVLAYAGGNNRSCVTLHAPGGESFTV